MSILDRAARGAMCIVFAATLAGFSWGNSEADQRKAFLAFLQDINNLPGIHLLVPTANDEKAFGPYLQQYAIILNFGKDMKARMDDFLAQVIKLGFGPNPAPRTIEQMAAAPTDLTAAKDAVDKMEQVISARLAKVNADRAALNQPDDLKAVYDKTFDKLSRRHWPLKIQPRRSMAALMPRSRSSITSMRTAPSSSSPGCRSKPRTSAPWTSSGR